MSRILKICELQIEHANIFPSAPEKTLNFLASSRKFAAQKQGQAWYVLPIVRGKNVFIYD